MGACRCTSQARKPGKAAVLPVSRLALAGVEGTEPKQSSRGRGL